MPLSNFVKQQLAGIRDFLIDPRGFLLEIHAMPEQERLVTRLLLSVAEEAEGLFVGVDGPFGAGDELCRRLEAALDESIEQALLVYEADGVAAPPGLMAKPPMPLEIDGAGDAEARLIARGELIARAVYPVFDHVALVIRVHADEPRAPLAACFARLVAAAGGGRLKLIVVAGAPVCAAAARAAPATATARLSALSVGEGETAREAVAAFVRAPLRRVLVYDAPRRGQTWLTAELRALAARSAHVVAHADGVRFVSPGYFFGRCAERIVTTCAERAPAGCLTRLASRAQAPLGRSEAEVHFVELLEELVDAWLPPRAVLLALLTPRLPDVAGRPEQARAMRGSLARLARAAVSSRVKVVVAGRGLDDALLDAGPGPREVRVQEVRLDGPTIEAGVRERLAAPDLSPIERLRLTSALASFAITGGDPDQALELGMAALALAQQSDVPEEVAVAHFGLGGLLYRCAALDKAAAAYTTALELAIARDNAPLAAQAVTGIGNCYFVIGDDDQAIRAYGVARTYFARLANPVGEAYALTWTGEAHARARRADEAERCLRAALACCDRARQGADASRAEILQRLARVYKQAGLVEPSRHCLAQAQSQTGGPLIAPATEP